MTPTRVMGEWDWSDAAGAVEAFIRAFSLTPRPGHEMDTLAW
jgi:hypothetical protein